MAKKETIEAPDVFGGFEALSKSLLGDSNIIKKNDADSEIPYVDPEDLKDDVEEDLDEETIDKDVDEEEEEVEVKPKTKVPTKKSVEPEEEEEETPKVKTPSKDEDMDEEVDTELETEVTSFLKDRLAEELGWELDDEDKFESIKDVVDYMKVVVEENSKPRYHSEVVKRLDEYVKNGGSMDTFFKEVYGGPTGIDYDSLDLTRESNQRTVIKELLKTKGYDDNKITKAIDRYEKSETLQEEAEDAVELLKEYKSEQQQKLLEEQENFSKDNRIKQQMFYDNVQKNIRSLESVRGVKISNREKDELLDYIFKPDPNGLTKYQQDYMSDIKNLIESAYFTKKGDSLIDEAKKRGSSDAYKEFHQKIKASKGKRSKNSGTPEESSDSDLLGSLSKHLLNKV
jgi:hypothetical protein